MVSANASEVQLAYKIEGSYGTSPTGAAYQGLNYVSENFKQDTETKQSQIITPTAQIKDVIRVGIGGAPTFETELMYGDYDDLFLAGIRQATSWTSGVELVSTATATTFTAPDTVAATGIDTGAIAGAWIWIAHSPADSNDGFWRNATVATDTLTVWPETIETDTSSVVVIKQLEHCTTGVNLDSFTFEKNYATSGIGADADFAAYPGSCIESFGVAINDKDIVTANFGLVSQKEISGTAALGGAGYTAASTEDVYNSIDHLYGVAEGVGTTSELYPIQNCDFTLKNNLDARTRPSQLGIYEVGIGAQEAEGSHTAYYEDERVMDEYLDFDESGIGYIVYDSVNYNGYIFDFPAIRYTDGSRLAGGNNQPVIADMKWAAKMHDTFGWTCSVSKIDPA